MSISANILFLFLGWFLGLFSPIIVDIIRKRLARKELKASFFNELDEVRERLVNMVHLIVSKFGKYDRELLLWVRANMKDSLDIVNSDGEKQSEVIDRLLQLNDEQLANIDTYHKVTGGDNLSLKSINLPLINAKLELLSQFDVEFQRGLLDIRTQINFMNEEIEQTRFYFKMTFDGGISEDNHSLITQNLEHSNLQISRMARTIVTKIISFAQRYSDQV